MMRPRIPNTPSIKIVEIRSEEPIQFNIKIDGVLHYWRSSTVELPEPGEYINEFIVVNKQLQEEKE